MPEIDSIKINKKLYCLADDLKKIAPKMFRGSRNGRTFVKKLDIEHIFVRKSGDNWEESDGSSNRVDKVAVRRKWITENVPEFNDKKEYDVKDAPEVIELEDKEKFLDADGNIIEIEVRGERKLKECYFLLSDVSRGFDIPGLKATIFNKQSRYQRNVEYVNFNCSTGKNLDQTSNKLFLTYKGLLRVLYGTNNKKTDPFIDWSINVLFTAHLGDMEDRINLIAELAATTPKNVASVLNKNAISTPCLYIIDVGNAKVLRKQLNLPNYTPDVFVCKFGQTISLSRRILEHNRDYKDLEGAKLNLLYYHFIDPAFVDEAETEFNEAMKQLDYKITTNSKYRELILCNKKRYNKAVEIMNKIGAKYSNHMKEVNGLLKDKDIEILRLNAQLIEKDVQLKEKDVQLAEKDNIITGLTKDLEISEKNLEITKLKFESQLRQKDRLIKRLQKKKH